MPTAQPPPPIPPELEADEPARIFRRELCRWALLGALTLGVIMVLGEAAIGHIRHSTAASVGAVLRSAAFGAAAALWLRACSWWPGIEETLGAVVAPPRHVARHLGFTAAGLACGWWIYRLLGWRPEWWAVGFLGLAVGAIGSLRPAQAWLDPWDAPSMVDRALDLADRNPRLALAAFAAAIRRDPGYARAFYERAVFLQDQTSYSHRPNLGRFLADFSAPRETFAERAYEDLTEAIRLEPAYAEAYFLRARLWTWRERAGAGGEEDHATRALADLDAAVRLAPRDAAPYLARGEALAAGNDPRALDDFTEAIRLAPGDFELLMARGKAWLARGDAGRADADFEEAARLAPEDTQLLVERGKAWLAGGDAGRALADFDAALRLSPGASWYYHLRSEAHRALGDYGRAEADLALARAAQEKGW